MECSNSDKDAPLEWRAPSGSPPEINIFTSSEHSAGSCRITRYGPRGWREVLRALRTAGTRTEAELPLELAGQRRLFDRVEMELEANDGGRGVGVHRQGILLHGEQREDV